MSNTPKKKKKGTAPLVFTTSGGTVQLTGKRKKESCGPVLNDQTALEILIASASCPDETVDEVGVARNICESLVSNKHFLLAWVGRIEQDNLETIAPVAHAGKNDGYLETVTFQWGDDRDDPSVTGKTARTKKLQIENDLSNCDGRWATQAIRRGMTSAAAAPVYTQNGMCGVLTVFSDATDAFSQREIQVLEALSSILGSKIESLKCSREMEAIREDFEETEKEKDKIQTQLFQSQKMEALGRLAGGISHDFNNLLTEIIGHSDLLQMQWDKEDKGYQSIEAIKMAGERAAQLTSHLLAFSRRQVLKRKILRINAIVEEAQKMLNRLIGEDVDLLTYLDPDAKCIEADRGQLEQVILNLVVNARHAMPEGGKLTIATEKLTVDGYDASQMNDARPGEFICLSVRDTGCGMDENTRKHIFDPFFTTRDKNKGTGLGLSVVYGIVKQHGGWIDVISELGQGTVFRIFLPISDVEMQEFTDEMPVLKDLQGHGQKILVVEDEEGVRKFVKMILSENGYDIVAAGSAREALKLFDELKGRIDLLFSDVVLKDLSGLQLTSMLQERKKDLKVLITSGHTMDDDQWELISQQRLPFLQKPYTTVSLLQKLETVLR